MSASLYGGIIEIGADRQPIVPDIVLAYRSGQKQNIIQNVWAFVVANHLMDAAEISFDVHKTANGVECALWDDIKGFKLVYIPHFDTATFNPWYELAVTVDENDETVKHCHGIHIQEAELSQLTLNGLEVNTEDDIARTDYEPTVLYDSNNPEASLLNRILKDKASHYSVHHVDTSVANMQRTFSWDGVTVKDAFDDIATELECIFIYGESAENDGRLHRTVSVYDLNDYCLDCGERGVFNDRVCTKCGSANIRFGYGEDSGVFLNHDNFAQNITYSSNKDDVKNCFRLIAGDDLMTATIRNLNPTGTQYIWYLSDDVRSEMSPALQARLSDYDELYNQYVTGEQIDIPVNVVNEYNALISQYQAYDDTLTNIAYPIMGYASLTDIYYSALNFHSLLQTTLAPEYAHAENTTAAEEIQKLTPTLLSTIGVERLNGMSLTTANSVVVNYVRVYIDTSLYKVTVSNSAYNNHIWHGQITLTSYTDNNDTATTPILDINMTDATAEYLQCQLDKAVKKNDIDATGVVALFKKNDDEFKNELNNYSADNLNILANISRGCLDVLIQRGIADTSSELYTTMYLPYYNKNTWIQNELREREGEILKLRGTKSSPTGLLDYIEAQRLAIAVQLDIHTFLGDTLWTEFCSFRRDDNYQNDNFISDGLSDRELIVRAQEFIERANRDIVKSATLQHTISCNLSNFLLVGPNEAASGVSQTFTTNNRDYSVSNNSVFSPLMDNFETGNWLHIEIDGKLYRLRLTDYEIDYDKLDMLNVEFSDVTYGLGSMSDIQDILDKTQSMTTSYSTTQRQANKGNNANIQIINMVENGLDLTNRKIINSVDNQNMLVDDSGMLMREKNEYGDSYSPEQVKIINHGLYYTNDNWRTVQTGLGKYIYYDPETGTYKEDYGIIAHKIVGNIILGNDLKIYNQSGSVKIDDNGMVITADPNDVNPNLFTIQKRNEDNSYTKYLYIDDDGNIRINSNSIIMSSGRSMDTHINEVVENSAASLVMQLSNEYIGINTDSGGNNGDYSHCSTTVKVFSGSTDITTADFLTWNVVASDGVDGVWNEALHTYTVNNLSQDSGQVSFSIEHSNGLSANKIFKIEKIKNGIDGSSGENGEDATVLRIDSSRGTVFKNNAVSTVLSVAIYHGSQRITDIHELHETFGLTARLEWQWQRLNENSFGIVSSTDPKISDSGFTFTLTPDDVDTKVTFICNLLIG